METYDICVELNKLASAGILDPRAATACADAASLLPRLREVILGTDERDSNLKIARLKEILAQHQEG